LLQKAHGADRNDSISAVLLLLNLRLDCSSAGMNAV